MRGHFDHVKKSRPLWVGRVLIVWRCMDNCGWRFIPPRGNNLPVVWVPENVKKRRPIITETLFWISHSLSAAHTKNILLFKNMSMDLDSSPYSLTIAIDVNLKHIYCYLHCLVMHLSFLCLLFASNIFIYRFPNLAQLQTFFLTLKFSSRSAYCALC